MTTVDPEAIAAEVRRVLLASGADLEDPATRAAVVEAMARQVTDRKLTAAQKRGFALDLRTHGATYREIARLVGYSGPGAAYKGVMAALVELQREPAEQLRQLSVERLEGLLAGGLYRKAKAGDLAALDRVLAVMRESRRYIPGLEVPTNAEVTGAGGGAIIVELNVPDPEPVAPVPQAELGGLPLIELSPADSEEIEDADVP